MKSYLSFTAGLCAGAALLLAAIPALASSVDIIVTTPGVYAAPQPVYVEPRPVYVLPQYEQDWRQRQRRAIEWQDTPHDHWQAFSDARHEHDWHEAHQYKHRNKHKNKHSHKHDD